MVRYGSLPFEEQIRLFLKKRPQLSQTWTDVYAAEHDHAFMVAGAAKADLLADLREAVQKAIAEGTTLEQFRKDFDAIVEKRGWLYTGGRNWRTRVIFETNLRQSYNMGREAQMADPQLRSRRPFGLYRHGHSEHPRPEHLAWDGTVLALDDPWWETHSPQNGWGCKCRKMMVSAADAKRMGLKVAQKAPPIQWEEKVVGARGPNPHTVRVPKGIDPGFEHRPGATRGDLIADKIAALPPDISALLKKEVENRPLFAIDDKALNDNFNAAFADAPERFHPLIRKYARKTRYEITSGQVSHYQQGVIRINLTAEKRQDKGNSFARGQVYRHEFGHAVSHQAAGRANSISKWLSGQAEFRKACMADARALATARAEKTRRAIRADLMPGGQMADDCDLSDFFGCLTKNKVVGLFRHADSYLKRRGAGQEEVLANLFDMMTRKDTSALDYARKHAPRVVKAAKDIFETVIKEVGDGSK